MIRKCKKNICILVLQKIDMYGQPVQLKINGHSNHQTEVGGVASILTITIVFFFFSSNILSFTNRGNLSAIVVSDFQEVPEFTKLNMKLAVGFTNISAFEYFNVSLQQMQVDFLKRIIENQVITNATNLILTKCTDPNFMSNYWCVEQFINLYDSANQDFLLGQVENKKYEIQLTVSRCANCIPDIVAQQVQLVFQNQVVNPMDASENYIQTFLDDTYSVKFTPNTFSKEQEIIVTQYDLNNDDSLFYTDLHQSKAYVVDQRDCRQTVNAESDVYASFTFKKNRVKVTINRSYQKVTDLLARLGGFLKITFFILGFAFQIYNRLQCNCLTQLVYLILANKVYEFSFNSVTQRKNQDKQFEVLHSALQSRLSKTNIGNVNDEGDQQHLPISRIKQKQNSIKISQRSSFNLLPMTSPPTPVSSHESKKQPTDEEGGLFTGNILENHVLMAKKFNCQNGLDYFQKQINIIINRSQPLQLTLKIFLNHVFCSKLFKSNVHVTLYQKSMKEISNHLDVHYILQKLEELNKLKSILLTQEQLLVFNFTPKQMIAPDLCELRFNRHSLEEKARTRHNTLFNDQNLSIFKRRIQDSENIIYSRIYSAYDSILKQYEGEEPRENNDINKQLINKLGVELQTIFKVSKMIDFSQIQGMKSSRRVTRRKAQMDNEIQATKMMQEFYQI